MPSTFPQTTTLINPTASSTAHWIWSSAKDVERTVTNGGAANWAFFGLKRPGQRRRAGYIHRSYGRRRHVGRSGPRLSTICFPCEDHPALTLAWCSPRDSASAQCRRSPSTNHQRPPKQGTPAAANYNIWLLTNTHQKIAYLGITGMSDDRCPFIQNAAQKKGGRCRNAPRRRQRLHRSHKHQ